MRAKLKVMLDKTSDKLNKEPNSEERSVVVFAPPSAADIARIEGDSFEPARFVSHRAAKKVERERERERPLALILCMHITHTGCPIWSGWS